MSNTVKPQAFSVPPQITEQVVALALPFLLKALSDFLNRKATPANPVPKPEQRDPDNPKLLDDTVVPTPKVAPSVPSVPKVASIRVNLIKGEFSRELFPEEFDKPSHGLIKDLDGIQSGAQAINVGSKLWVDITPYREDGTEIRRSEVEAAGDPLYRATHRAGETFIRGGGGKPGQPNPGYTTGDSPQVGNSISAWKATNGYVQMFKFFEEGEYVISAELEGVQGKSFTVRVS